MIVTEILVLVVEIYFVVGILFGIAFVTRGVQAIDHAAMRFSRHQRVAPRAVHADRDADGFGEPRCKDRVHRANRFADILGWA